MLEVPIYVATIIVAIIALGELVSILTKAWIPSLMIILAGYLVLLWTGVIPPDLIPKSTMAAVGGVLIGVVITHMGTLIPISQIKSQYKAILIALIGMVLGSGLILLVVTPILGYASAVAGTGPVTGGIIAYLITAEKLTALGLDNLVAISAIVLGIQSLVGLPLANVLLRKYATKKRDRGDFLLAVEAPAGTPEPKVRRQLIPEKFQQPPILLLLLFLAASLAKWLDTLTGLNYGVWALLIGVGAHLIGLFPAKTMEKANSFGFGLVAIIVVIMGSVSGVTFEVLLKTIGPALLILGIGAIGIMAGGWFGSKLFKWDPLKGMPIALTALFGFPGDFMLCREVSRSVGRTPEEQKNIFDELVTPMLVAGFTNVTTTSILVASILVQTL
ncbi:hypothetical protein [Paeniglutamicibacter cryotolerans]|uniref:MFS family permease n=1 Tax=Paeniglutamicibacter cryotolerans TaxID=670079 RepID=A0A839QRZ9_9MICC|nr:hypothetical protein [Paeniglutamicibacter cryotolerans]MBB2996746.1 MFS family permease [Paeniglutamicibacter cryotolerans]